MSGMREVATLWIGGSLSWLEQLCLTSFVDAGQPITLYAYGDIPNVPKGVRLADGRDILATDDFLKYEKKDSYALFADLFRLHLLRARPGVVWVDTDVYCHRPLCIADGHVMGYELPGERRVNNAVLGLPADSAILAAMLAFTADPFAIPPWLKPKLRADYAAAAAAGAPVHVSRQPWAVWGPMMLTHFVDALGLHERVQPLDAFYPVTFPERLKMLKPAEVVERRLTARTSALHLWASNKRELGLRHMGLPPPGSYLAALCARHAIRPEAAPIRGRGRRQFDAGLVEAIDLPEVTSLADLGGTAQSLALAAHARWDCELVLIDADHRGRFAEAESPWVGPYRAFLADHGVPAGRVRVVRRAGELRPVDLLVNLAGFGDTAKIRHIEPFLDACLHAGSRVLLDIRKGSGGFPLLAGRGACTTLSTREEGGETVARVRFAPAPPATPAPAPRAWATLARDLAGPDGFFTDNGRHSFLFVPRGDTLVVTFDNLDIAMGKREDRRPWGYGFIEKQGWSMLGVMAAGWTWYRDPWVAAEFDRLAAEGFFARFARVVFYGASMGGYAAAAFSPAAPGAEVVAISPQSTLDRRLVPFETRYRVAWDEDFAGRYGDAATVSAAARRVILLYDPHEPLDAGHADRFAAANVLKLRCPLLGHRLGTSLQQMGILNPIILAALDGSLTAAAFHRALRARKGFPRYQRELFARALARGRPGLARRVGRYALARGENRPIAEAMRRL